MTAWDFHKQILLLVILPLVLLEITFQVLGSPNDSPYWSVFQPLRQSKEEENVIILGSSRAATAIVPEILTSELRLLNVPAAKVYNLGMGYTKIAQFALLLKDLARENPLALYDSIILIEGDRGIPQDESWLDPWAHPAFPLLALPFMNKEDLNRLLESQSSYESKLAAISTFYLSLPGQLLMSRSVIFERGAELSKWLNAKLDSHQKPLDIARAGGIRFDQKAISDDNSLKEDCDVSQYLYQLQHPVIWQKSIVRDIAELADKYHSQLLFFDVPLRPDINKCLSNESVEDARKLFIKTAETWHAGSILVPQIFSNEDFADQKHLRLSKSSSYSKMLASSIRARLQSADNVH